MANVPNAINHVQINLYRYSMTKGRAWINHIFGALIASKKSFIKNYSKEPSKTVDYTKFVVFDYDTKLNHS
jgi:hypothetical protein